VRVGVGGGPTNVPLRAPLRACETGASRRPSRRERLRVARPRATVPLRCGRVSRSCVRSILIRGGSRRLSVSIGGRDRVRDRAAGRRHRGHMSAARVEAAAWAP
jgi:hypothetical protein